MVGVDTCDLDCVKPSFPAMRVAVRNNSQWPITVKEILVLVQKSERDQAPRLDVSFSPGTEDISNPSGGIILHNESRLRVTSARLDFDIKCALPDIASYPTDGSSQSFSLSLEAKVEPPVDPDKPDTQDNDNPFVGDEVGSISGSQLDDPQSIFFQFWQELSKVIPDIASVVRSHYGNAAESDEVKLLQRVDGLYKRSACKPYIVGRLSGTYAGPDNGFTSFETAVLTKVNVGICCGGASSDFDIPAGRANLRSAGANYQLSIPVGRTIRPGQAASIAFELTVDESSIHELTFQAVTDRGTADSKPYQARLYVPWSAILHQRTRQH